MDFYSLTRRELQALCKKNKIPANMTNIAMADALNALDHVEVLSDNLETIPDTPKRLAILSPDLPRTTRRAASTRRKSEVETETKGTNKVSETSETPVSRIDRRRATVTLVLPKMKEENEGGEEVGQNENLAVPVHSVRRSTRLVDKKTSQSTQKKGSRRAEAVKIPVFSEEEGENLEGQPKGAEIPDLEEDKETKSMISGEVLKSTSETSLAASSVVESGDTTHNDDVCITEPNDDVCITKPLAAEGQRSLSFATKENEQDLHGEPEQLEDEDGSAIVQECMSRGKICNSTSKDSAAEISSSKESVFEDLRVHEQSEAGEGSEHDDKNPIFVVQNQENQSGEGLSVGEDKVTSDCGSTEGEIYEIHPLESTCLNLCSREDPEVIGKEECNCGFTVAAINDLVGEVIVEVLSEAEEVSYLSPEKMDVIRPQENPQTECDQSAGQLGLQLEEVTNHFTEVLQLQNDELASDQQQKMNAEEVYADVADHFAELGGNLMEGSDVAESSEEEKSCENVDVSCLCSVEQDEKPSHEEHYNVAATTENVTVADALAEMEVQSTQEFTSLEKILLLNDCNDHNSASYDAFSSKSHLEGTISLPDHPANDAISTPTPRKGQTPRKSGNKKRTTPTQLMVFEDNKNTSEIRATKLGLSVASPNVFDDNKENKCEISATKLGLSVASPKSTARLEMGKKKAISILSPERYKDKSRRQLIKMIKEKEKLLENKRPALQTLNEN